jgi:SAM-dependent methyltransferase
MTDGVRTNEQKLPGELSPLRSTHSHNLADVDTHALIVELANRAERGISIGRGPTILPADAVVEHLGKAVDVHWNRFSMQRQCDLFWMFVLGVNPPGPPIEGEVYLDLGCGSIHPYGFGMLMCLLGAKQSIAVDLAKPQDVPRAVRNLARLADWLLQNPKRLVRDLPITRDQIERNLASFDLDALRNGDPSGLRDHVVFRCEAADALSLATGSVGVVVSNSFLEHVDDIHAVLSELARVTKQGGFGVHAIDTVDHDTYARTSLMPLDFLRRPAGAMVNGSNRLRFHEYGPVFEQHGFEVRESVPSQRIQLSDEEIASFAEPWSKMPREALEVVQGRIVVRKR